MKRHTYVDIFILIYIYINYYSFQSKIRQQLNSEHKEMPLQSTHTMFKMCMAF